MNNLDNYEPLASNPTSEIARTSNELVQELKSKNYIDEKCHDWALIDENRVRTHLFYHIPKIHKSLINPPGRPIVSGIGGPTENLSRLVDHWLQPAVQQLPSYVKDSTHLLQQIQKWNDTLPPLTENTLLVTIDVVALYPSIPINEVAPAVTSILENATSKPDNIPDNRTLIKIIEHILKNNIFTFEDKFYKQIKGTAMGTPMAPTIANLFMGKLEQDLLRKSPWNIDIEFWRRFIDDIFILWQHGEDELKLFVNWLNEQHDSIKFTSQYGRKEVPYLDLNMSIENGKITTDLYKKTTDTNTILPFSSCHPRHCVRGIPYGQCLRLRRICSKDSDFKKRCLELKNNLTSRGYPKALVQNAINKVSKKTRTEVLEYKSSKSKDSEKRVPIIITHNPTHPPLAQWLRDGMEDLHTSRRMKQAMPRPPMVGERNCKNLRNILMPSATPPPKPQNSDQEAGCSKCAATRCVMCAHHIVETKFFKSVRTNLTYQIRDKVDCKSKNLIYLIDCEKCKDTQYVGETSQTLQRRFHGHRSNIKNFKQSNINNNSQYKNETLVARHFQKQDHDISHMKVTVIEQIRKDDTKLRKQRERFWRHKLKTNYPEGLNVWD